MDKPNRAHVLGCLGLGIAGSVFAMCGQFDPQVRLTNGETAPAWKTEPSSVVDSVLPGLGAVKLFFGLVGAGGFAGTIYLSRIVEEDERITERFRQQEEDAAYALEQARVEANIQKMQLEANAEVEAHSLIAEDRAKQYYANHLGVPIDVAYSEADEPQKSAVGGAIAPINTTTAPQPTDSAIPTEAVATPATVQDSTLSVYLGKSPEGREVFWNPSQQPNGFMLILGSSGAGKTETLKSITHEVKNFGIPCLVIDFHGDIDIPGIETICLSQSPVMPYGINPMELDSVDQLDGGVYPQIETLTSMLSTAIPAIGHRQHRVIKNVLRLAYETAGIDKDDVESWKKPAPGFMRALSILNELADECKDAQKRGILESSSDVLAKVFEHPVFAKSQQIKISELIQKSHRLDLSKLTPEIQFIVADTVLRKAARQLRSRGHIPVNPASDRDRYRLFTMVDEAKLLSMGGKNKEDRTAVLNVLATEYRKFGFGMVLSSQMADHFSEETKAQISTRLALKPGQEEKEVKRNAADMRLKEQDLTDLRGKGDGWLRVGNSLTRIQVAPLSDRI